MERVPLKVRLLCLKVEISRRVKLSVDIKFDISYRYGSLRHLNLCNYIGLNRVN